MTVPSGAVLVLATDGTDVYPASLSGYPSTITFQPGGTNGRNVYTDFGELCAALAASGTNAARILVDASFAGSSLPISAGTYALPATVYFEGLYDTNSQTTPTLALQDGAVFDPPPSVLGIALMDLATDQATSEVMRVPNGATLTLILRDASISAVGVYPFVYAPNGGVCQANLYGNADVAYGGTPVLVADISGTVNVFAYDASRVQSGAVDNSGAAGTVNITATSNANIESGNYAQQQSVANFSIIYPNGNAPPGSTSQVQYPGTGSYFASVEAAIDALAYSQENDYSELLLTDDAVMGTDNEEFGPNGYSLRGFPPGSGPQVSLSTSTDPLSSWVSCPLEISDLQIVNQIAAAKRFITMTGGIVALRLTRVQLRSLEPVEAPALNTDSDDRTYTLFCEDTSFGTENAFSIFTSGGTVQIFMQGGPLSAGYSFVAGAIVNDDAALDLQITLSQGANLPAGVVSGTQPATFEITILDPTVTIDPILHPVQRSHHLRLLPVHLLDGDLLAERHGRGPRLYRLSGPSCPT